jgi:BirA family biotin operon repressor/biotin-[acetyl-CoA-carboxylase] ligase
MAERDQQILQILSDGEFHSGEDLAARLGISRAAIWKVVQTLMQQGLEIYAVPGRGYRLAEALELLDEELIGAALDTDTGRLISSLEVHQQIDSTNTYLMSRAKCGAPGGSVCLAEAQSAGRGRQGRSWVSPYGANLYLSLLWRFSLEAVDLAGLSLVTGVAVARTLAKLGVAEIGLKWPNDVLWRQRKLGGILLEFGGESTGPCFIVAGIGLNVAMAKTADSHIDQPWVDLREILGPGRVSRNRLAARLIGEVAGAFAAFERAGFATVAEEWKRLDLAVGRRIELRLPNRSIGGIGRGVDAAGALLIETGNGIERYLGGEISLRLET